MKHIHNQAPGASPAPRSRERASTGGKGDRNRNSWALALTAIALTVGCASAPDRYYTLAQPAAADGTARTGAGAAMPAVAAPVTDTFIELAPVAMPERLARPQMVVNRSGTSGAEVALLEQHRWTSSFENELRDALAAGIAQRLGAIDLTKGGVQPGQPPAWRIAVQLREFDAVENSRVDAGFGWTVRRADASRSVACRWSGSEPAPGGIEAVAVGTRRLAARLSERIARHVAALRINADAPCAAD
jgi:uncharacterized lipoprotein YmbA